MSRLAPLRAYMVAGTLFRLAAAGLLAMLIWQVWRLPRTIGAHLGQRLDRIEKRVSDRDEQVRKLLETVQAAADDNYWDAKASAETTTAMLRETYELVREAREQLLGKRGLAPVLIEARGTLLELQSTLRTLDQTARRTDANVNDAVLPNLAKTLESTQQAVVHLDERTEAVLANTSQATENLAALIADPHLKATMENLQKMSQHGAKSMENTEKATGYVAAYLNPKKQTFWRKVFFEVIPRPAVKVGAKILTWMLVL